MKKIHFLFLSLVVASVLTACGQTGALVLPNKTSTPTSNP